jgi:hypothetical protein
MLKLLLYVYKNEYGLILLLEIMKFEETVAVVVVFIILLQ